MDCTDVTTHNHPADAPAAKRMAVLLTSYNTGACKGLNLGIAGYSHDIVANLFIPLLSRWGEVYVIPDPRNNLEAAIQEMRNRNLEPVHVSILPFQDVCLTESAPNIVVPAWEFPDIPNEAFDDNPQNKWPDVAAQCKAVFVGGPFTFDALRNAGITVPMHIVPVPTPDPYFELREWAPQQSVSMEIPAMVLPQDIPATPEKVRRLPARQQTKPPPTGLKRWGLAIEAGIRNVTRSVVGSSLYERYERCQRALKAGYHATLRPTKLSTLYRTSPEIELSGIVYTSIFNPLDGRKNWSDLLTGFLMALGDCKDATLVVKLAASRPDAAQGILDYYRDRNIPHRCKVIFITEFLTESQLHDLAAASTFYIQTTRAEGNCLPLMNYLAAARPAISPCHTAIADYFDDQVGFVVESHPEPAAFPHDPELRCRTTWARIVWPSLVKQIRASYRMAKSDPDAYRAMSTRARERMNGWASSEAVWSRLSVALDSTVAAANLEVTPQIKARRAA
ncbi:MULTISPECIES: glycosyltransferase [unclassified Schlesneria]|uniref:glycosyltransferase n=1 Tax=unclassified Schlesneria TaxID=2762017 RepID=UPI002F05A238